MINDILDFSKIEAGKLEHGGDRLRPARLSWRTRQSCWRRRPHDKGLEFAVTVDPEDVRC